MCLQLIAREALNRVCRERIYNDLSDAAALERYGYRHGWVHIDGVGYNHELAFPEIRFPRFPADQGLND